MRVCPVILNGVRLLQHEVDFDACRSLAGSICTVPRHQVTWLGLKAFQHMMTSKETMYRDVLKRLGKELRNPDFLRLPGTCQEAVSIEHSADFQTIHF